MATKYGLQEVALLKSRDIFIDANILIYLFWSTGKYSFEQNYARVFNKLLKQKNNLFVDFLVISEVVNRTIKFEYEKYLLIKSISKEKLKYKTYRNSEDGINALNDIYIIVKDRILKNFTIIGKSFNKMDIENFLLVDELDFVDKATVLLCKENSFVLLTNDRDFKNVDLDILTANPHILN